MFSWAQKRTNYWSKIRKKAPKVPDITCPAIDDVLNQLEMRYSKGPLTYIDHKTLRSFFFTKN